MSRRYTRTTLPEASMFLALLACSSVESKDVDTGGIWPDFSIIADGMGATAGATLRVGDGLSNTFVNLDEPDSLWVDDGGKPIAMTEVNLGELYSYTATVTTDAPGTTYTFDFQRGVLTSAPASTVTMPDALEITSPKADTVFSRAQAVTVTWDPSGSTDEVMVTLQSDCVIDATVLVAGDPGTYTFEPGSYLVPEERELDSCDATLRVERVRAGTLDAAFTGGGSILAKQVREQSVRLDP